jgi:hypothetical protein
MTIPFLQLICILVLNFLIFSYQLNKINQQWDVKVCPAAYFNTETTRFYYKYYWEYMYMKNYKANLFPLQLVQ